MWAAIAILAAATNLAEVHSLDDVLQAFGDGSRVRVVNVWATWCVPCVAEIGELQAISDAYKKSGVEVIGVSLDDAIPGERAASKQKLAAFLTKRKISFRNVYYIGSPANLTEQLHFDGSIPITVVFDANGKEIARNEGKLDRDWFIKQLDQLSQRRHK